VRVSLNNLQHVPHPTRLRRSVCHAKAHAAPSFALVSVNGIPMTRQRRPSKDHPLHSPPDASTVCVQLVGFVGLGNMGSEMAARLVASGYQLLVYDRNPEAVRKLQQQGARVARSPIEIALTPGG
jgi:hypothetical protein